MENLPEDPNQFDTNGKNALHRALQDDTISAEFVEKLIELGADVNQVTTVDQEEMEIYNFDSWEELGMEVPESIASMAKTEKEKYYTPLHFACKSADTEKVAVLLSNGADVLARSSGNYSSVLDAAYWALNQPIEKAKQRIGLLVDAGADLEVASSYGETPLKTAISRSNWPLVKLLLELGALAEPLQWNDLFFAIALDCPMAVKDICDKDSSLINSTDYAGLSPIQRAVSIGDIEKVKILVASGADLNVTGRCGESLLFTAVEVNAPDLCQWLIEQGLNVNAIDEFDNQPIHTAIQEGSAECIDVLIESGVDIYQKDKYGFGLVNEVNDLKIAKKLISAGLDPTELNRDIKHELVGLPSEAAIDCTKAEYTANPTRRFGTKNPEIMDFPFWRTMVSNGGTGYCGASHFDDCSFDRGEPTWCFSRFGHSFTQLKDGRVIEIGGEHEDSYDPDFCIYNDVVVHDGKGDFTIYGYPETCFPPTDFHSATLVGEFIYIIGGLGYPERRKPKETPVYRLHTDSLKMEQLESSGVPPGWIFKHRATWVGSSIRIEGGKFLGDDKDILNKEVFEFDIKNRVWSKSS